MAMIVRAPSEARKAVIHKRCHPQTGMADTARIFHVQREVKDLACRTDDGVVRGAHVEHRSSELAVDGRGHTFQCRTDVTGMEFTPVRVRNLMSFATVRAGGSAQFRLSAKLCWLPHLRCYSVSGKVFLN